MYYQKMHYLKHSKPAMPSKSIFNSCYGQQNIHFYYRHVQSLRMLHLAASEAEDIWVEARLWQ